MSSNNNITWVVMLLVLALAGACSYAPGYEGSLCADDKPRCPEGFTCHNGYCTAASNTAEEPPATGDDGGSSDDGNAADAFADPGADPGSDPSGDPGADAGGDYPDGGDSAGADGADQPGDEDPCAGKNCPEGFFCNPRSGSCTPCQVDSHCGPDCLTCPNGEQCGQMGGEYCCRPDCSFENSCRQFTCGGSGWTCSLKFNPERWEWNQDTGITHYCTLQQASEPGVNQPVAGTFHCLDQENLGFYCTYDGACDDGVCVPNPAQGTENSHPCGGVFGCNESTNRCRLHKKAGSSCKFNYDCQSFCCSRDSSATCVSPEANRANCKIAATEYRSDWTNYTWVAYAELDPHDIASWGPHSGHDGPACQNDADCDSGKCSGGSDKTCHFANCMGYDPENNYIRSHYFCSANVGDGTTDDYLPTVTNSDPLPQDSECN